MLPNRSAIYQLDVVYGTNFHTYSAAFAFCVVASVAFVGCGYELAEGQMLFCV